MGPYKPLRTWVDEFIPYYMEISWELIDPIAHIAHISRIMVLEVVADPTCGDFEVATIVKTTCTINTIYIYIYINIYIYIYIFLIPDINQTKSHVPGPVVLFQKLGVCFILPSPTNQPSSRMPQRYTNLDLKGGRAVKTPWVFS